MMIEYMLLTPGLEHIVQYMINQPAGGHVTGTVVKICRFKN